ncbi:TonB family protein [Erythrobacter arachoides]|uniref:TonB family protein n=1 Tax=Aurantiacibacter arachoides TaxID=1850444 RepID=A0A845A2F6_9SPHN|nr:energy transducer TonB [Aurantiacibacter arachoides]MXO93622.1 TonB family protein [Aurantiacibacter arachoides]GGD47981.1 hypothetical protein GCM10011411_04610 [Aurantiacibacter arachoides]
MRNRKAIVVAGFVMVMCAMPACAVDRVEEVSAARGEPQIVFARLTNDQAPPAAVPGRAAQPVNLATLVRRINADYPVAAKRQRRQGTVGVSVDVTARGEVASCMVSRSSGHPVLDAAACNGI